MTMGAPSPWTKYREHADAYAYRQPEALGPFYMRASTPNSSAEWAQQMRKADPAHGLMISEPHPSNPMQSAPYVLFASYDARGRYRTASHPRITGTHPYAITTYCEGDLTTEFYPTAEARAHALYLLQRAL